MADMGWGTNALHGDGTALIQGTIIARLDSITGPNIGTTATAHGIAAGFTLIRAWIVASDGRILPDDVTQVAVDATNLDWVASTNMSGLTGEGFIEYLP